MSFFLRIYFPIFNPISSQIPAKMYATNPNGGQHIVIIVSITDNPALSTIGCVLLGGG